MKVKSTSEEDVLRKLKPKIKVRKIKDRKIKEVSGLGGKRGWCVEEV